MPKNSLDPPGQGLILRTAPRPISQIWPRRCPAPRHRRCRVCTRMRQDSDGTGSRDWAPCGNRGADTAGAGAAAHAGACRQAPQRALRRRRRRSDPTTAATTEAAALADTAMETLLALLGIGSAAVALAVSALPAATADAFTESAASTAPVLPQEAPAGARVAASCRWATGPSTGAPAEDSSAAGARVTDPPPPPPP